MVHNINGLDNFQGLSHYRFIGFILCFNLCIADPGHIYSASTQFSLQGWKDCQPTDQSSKIVIYERIKVITITHLDLVSLYPHHNCQSPVLGPCLFVRQLPTRMSDLDPGQSAKSVSWGALSNYQSYASGHLSCPCDHQSRIWPAVLTLVLFQDVTIFGPVISRPLHKLHES